MAATAAESDTGTDSEAIASLLEESAQPVEITVEAAGSAVKTSATRKQLTALEGMVREGGKFIFNVVGLGTCYSLVTQK